MLLKQCEPLQFSFFFLSVIDNLMFPALDTGHDLVGSGGKGGLNYSQIPGVIYV